ncbi:MAG: hypothetical protein JWQ25_6, partial [Daejeonella sp.]|nr:hypothetical protein [Daejeonella sp.]
MAKNKKKSANVAPLLSDESYIKSGKARKLEIHKCLINDDWQETGIAQVVVMREHINGNVTAGIFLVDLLCAGVKDSFFMFNVDENLFLYKFKQMQSESMQNIVTCDYVLAHNIIYGAIEFADDFNIKPCSEFKITQMILEEDNDDVPLMDVDFGRDGKPCLIGDEDDPKTQYYLQRLRTYAGEGNFEFIAAIDDFEEGEDKDEDDFD